jgi:hypothetical protein
VRKIQKLAKIRLIILSLRTCLYERITIEYALLLVYTIAGVLFLSNGYMIVIYSILFVLDFVFALVCATRWIFAVLCMYYVQAFMQTSWWALLVPGMLVLLETFVFTGCLGVDLSAMVPLMYIIFILKKYIHQDVLLTSVGAGTCVVLHMLIVYHGFFGRSVGSLLSLKSGIIHGILIIVVYYFLQGSQGNRLP